MPVSCLSLAEPYLLQWYHGFKNKLAVVHGLLEYYYSSFCAIHSFLALILLLHFTSRPVPLSLLRLRYCLSQSLSASTGPASSAPVFNPLPP